MTGVAAFRSVVKEETGIPGFDFTADGAPFRNAAGILSGNPVRIAALGMERLDKLFTMDGL